MRQAEPVAVSRAATTASGEQQARSASGPAGSSQSRSVTPIRVLPRPQERDGAVHAAAHRHGHARRRVRRGGRHGPSAFASASTGRVSPPTAAASSSDEPLERRVEPLGRVGLDDPVAVQTQAKQAQSPFRDESPKTSTMRRE